MGSLRNNTWKRKYVVFTQLAPKIQTMLWCVFSLQPIVVRSHILYVGDCGDWSDVIVSSNVRANMLDIVNSMGKTRRSTS